VAIGGVGGDVVVAAANVLREGVAGGEDPCGAVTSQSAHRPEPGFQPSVVRFDRIVRVLLDCVPCGGDQLVHARVGRRAISGDLDRDRAGAQRPDEETPGRGQVTPGQQQRQMSKSPSRRFPVTVTQLPVQVTRCQICHRTVAYRPGNLTEVLTEHYRRAHPEALDLASR